MNATIITIGNEILIGQTIDTNSTYIAKELNKIGINVKKIISLYLCHYDNIMSTQAGAVFLSHNGIRTHTFFNSVICYQSLT